LIDIDIGVALGRSLELGAVVGGVVVGQLGLFRLLWFLGFAAAEQSGQTHGWSR
jgi:hypothetical protein